MARKLNKQPLRNNDPYKSCTCTSIQLVTIKKGEVCLNISEPNANVWFKMHWDVTRTYENTSYIEFISDGEVWFTLDYSTWFLRSIMPPAKRYVRDAIRRWVRGEACRIHYSPSQACKQLALRYRHGYPQAISLVDKDTLMEVPVNFES